MSRSRQCRLFFPLFNICRLLNAHSTVFLPLVCFDRLSPVSVLGFRVTADNYRSMPRFFFTGRRTAGLPRPPVTVLRFYRTLSSALYHTSSHIYS